FVQLAVAVLIKLLDHFLAAFFGLGAGGLLLFFVELAVAVLVELLDQFFAVRPTEAAGATPRTARATSGTATFAAFSTGLRKLFAGSLLLFFAQLAVFV